MPEAMVTLGKKKRLPFLILAGLLIAFFGVPLGLRPERRCWPDQLRAGRRRVILIVAFSLILAGWLSAVIMIVRIFSPAFLDPWIDIYPLVPDPAMNTVIYILGALLLAALGFGLLWLGSRLMRGVRFVFRFLIGKIKNWRKKAPATAAVQP